MVEEKKRRRAKGDGGLTQSATGLWRGRVELPSDPDTGKRRFSSVSSMSKTEAQRKLNKVRAELNRNGDLPTGNETVAKWMDFWIENVSKTRPSTREGYRSSIKYINAAIGKIRLSKLTAQDVRRVETLIVVTKSLSPTTARQAYSVLSRALKDAEREGRILRNVAKLIDPPRKAFTRLEVLTAEHGIRVIQSVTEERLGSRIAAALLTGARQGELLGLEIDRVFFGTPEQDYEDASIDLSWQLQRVNWRHGCQVKCGRIRGTDCPRRRIDVAPDWEHRYIAGAFYWSRPKSRAGWRVIPLVDPLRAILLRRIEASLAEPNPHGLVWTSDPKKSKGGSLIRKELPLDGSPIDPSWDNHYWHHILFAAGVPDVRLHDARHTAVTILYELETPEPVIQDIVGQSTISVTRGYRARSQKQAHAAMSALGAALTAKLALPPAA